VFSIREEFFKKLVTRNILSVKENRLKILNNIDITMYGSKAWAYTLQEIGKKKGSDYLYHIGYVTGECAAREIQSITDKMKKFIPEELGDVGNVLEITGFGVVNIKSQDDKIIVDIERNHIIDYGYDLYNQDSMVERFYCGVYSAFIKVFRNLDVHLNNISGGPGTKMVLSS